MKKPHLTATLPGDQHAAVTDESELQCPCCQGLNLHQQSVEVFDRAEDAATGLHAMIRNGSVAVNTSMDGNPSQRRHGLRIQFTCETCADRPVLLLFQHGGRTYLRWTEP